MPSNPVDSLEAIKQALADLPDRLAAVLRQDGDRELRGQGGEKKPRPKTEDSEEPQPEKFKPSPRADINNVLARLADSIGFTSIATGIRRAGDMMAAWKDLGRLRTPQPVAPKAATSKTPQPVKPKAAPPISRVTKLAPLRGKKTRLQPGSTGRAKVIPPAKQVPLRAPGKKTVLAPSTIAQPAKTKLANASPYKLPARPTQMRAPRVTALATLPKAKKTRLAPGSTGRLPPTKPAQVSAPKLPKAKPTFVLDYRQRGQQTMLKPIPVSVSKPVKLSVAPKPSRALPATVLYREQVLPKALQLPKTTLHRELKEPVKPKLPISRLPKTTLYKGPVTPKLPKTSFYREPPRPKMPTTTLYKEPATPKASKLPVTTPLSLPAVKPPPKTPAATVKPPAAPTTKPTTLRTPPRKTVVMQPEDYVKTGKNKGLPRSAPQRRGDGGVAVSGTMNNRELMAALKDLTEAVEGLQKGLHRSGESAGKTEGKPRNESVAAGSVSTTARSDQAAKTARIQEDTRMRDERLGGFRG